MKKIKLILRCDGKSDERVVLCSSTKTVVLHLHELRHKEDYVQLLDYLDKVSKVFDGSQFNNNIIVNTLHKIHQLGFLEEKRYKILISWFYMHRPCGIILELEVED